MYLKNVFFPTNWRRHLLFFLFLHFFFFFCFFFFEKVCVINPYIFELFLEFLVNPFSLFTFFSRKNQPRNLHFLFLLNPFSVSLLLSTFFLIFYNHFFVHHFPSFLFVHPFLLFSSFSLLSFLHSFFISPSQCFSFSFFLYLMFTHLFFSIAVVAYPLFVLTHFSSVSLFRSWSLCFLASSHFFSSSPSLFFFFQKKSNFSVVNFLKTKLCLYFFNRPVICVKSRVFFLLASSFFLVCSMFSVVAIFHRFFSWSSLLFLIFFDQSSFWASQKKFVLFCRKVQTYHSPFNVFFVKISCISLFLSQKKTLKSDWFSFLFLLTSSRFVLSLCVLSLCLPCLLLLFLLTKKLVKKNLCFTIILRTFFKKIWKKNIVFISETSSFFSPFSILFHTRKTFFANKYLLYLSYLFFTFLKRKTLPYF